MNKKQLVLAVQKATKIESRKQVASTVDAAIAIIKAELKAGGRVALAGFGSFSTVERKARNGVNPVTKQKIKIKARKAPKFVASAELKNIVSKKKVIKK